MTNTRVLPILLLVILCSCLCSCSKPAAQPAPEPHPQPASADAGHTLLKSYTDAVETLKQGGGADAVLPKLDEQEKQAGELRTKGQISEDFSARHGELLKMTRLLLAPAPKPEDADTLRGYLTRVHGSPVEPAGMDVVGPILLDEALNLHMLLDGSTDRDKARSVYMPQ